MKPVCDSDVAAWFQIFGVNERAIMLASNDRATTLRELQATVKFVYKAMAVTMHPDHGGEEERWKEITAAYNAIGDLTVQPTQQARGNPFVGIRIDYWPWSSTSAAGSGSTTTR